MSRKLREKSKLGKKLRTKLTTKLFRRPWQTNISGKQFQCNYCLKSFELPTFMRRMNLYCKHICVNVSNKNIQAPRSIENETKFTLASLSGIPSVSYFLDSQVPMVMTVYHVKDPTKKKRDKYFKWSSFFFQK